MARDRIFSARTEKLEEMRSAWTQIFRGVEDRWELEDFQESSKTNEILAKFKTISPSQYMLNYLFSAFDMDIEEDDVEEVFSYISYCKDSGTKCAMQSRLSEKMLNDVVKRMSVLFRENGMTKRKSEPDYIMKILVNFNKSGFFDIALGLQMELEDVEIFLRKAMNQPGFNYYSKTEMLLWIVFRYGEGSYRKQYEALRKYYDAIPYNDNGCHEIIDSNTEFIRDKLEQYEIKRIFTEGKYGEPVTEIAEFLKWHKNILPGERTVSRVYSELWKGAVIANRKSIAAFHYLVRSAEQKLSDENIYFGEGDVRTMTVDVIPADGGMVLKKGAKVSPGYDDPMVKSARCVRNGTVTVDCEIGTYIEKGAIFLEKRAGNTYRYAAAEDKIAIKHKLFQEYMYGMEKNRLDENIDVSLLGDWFTDSKIDDNVRSAFVSRSPERQRAVILTLVFLKFVGECETACEYDLDVIDIFREFEEEADTVLGRCRMQGLYMGNPYDALLVFLLITTDTPIDTLRSLWAAVREKK